MTPFFIISTPRSRATLLMRILDASPGIRCAGESTPFLQRLRALCDLPAGIAKEHGAESWPMHRQHVDPEAWQETVAAMLKPWVNPPEGATHYGIRTSFMGRQNWLAACDAWSWMLQTWPGAKIIFLTRNQEEIERSMIHSQHLWRPAYGTCPGVCGQRVHDHLQSMRDFHAMNPTISALLDAEDLLDFEKTAAVLSSVGIPLDREAWQRELAVKSGTRAELREISKTRERRIKNTKEDEHPLFRTDIPMEEALRLAAIHPGTVKESRVAVFTLRFGNPPWMKPCSETLEAWCNRHGYALHVREPNGAEPDEKFSTLDMMREFLAGTAERMIFVDADVMIHESAPRWPEAIGFQARRDPGQKTVTDWREWIASEPDAEKLAAWPYCNSGVWSCDRTAAEAFLAVADGERRLGYREQHAFNAWWARAVEAGMQFSPLPAVWNVLPSIEPEGIGWMHHLAGKKKERLLAGVRKAKRLTEPVAAGERLSAWMNDPFGDQAEQSAIAAWHPAKPWQFTREEPLHDRAIILPWLSKAAAWGEEELRHALRSWHENFTDHDCPIYILGDRKPSFLANGGRVQFLPIDYSKGREHGLRLAYAKGLQIAEEVLLTNDDFYLLKPTGWDDFEIALHRGSLADRAERYLAADDSWLNTLGTVCRDLQKAGVRSPKDFATHTPFYYERRKAVETLERFHLRYRGSFETLYHNHHGTPSKPMGNRKTKTLPAPHGARFLNHNDRTLGATLRREIQNRFHTPAPWEAMPKLIHQIWTKGPIPREHYPKAWQDSWGEHHPEWKYKLWSSADLLKLAREHYPRFRVMLRKAREVVKADLGRLLILHHHGGIYADLDYLALGPLDGLLSGVSLAVPAWDDGAMTNALMAGLPGQQLFLECANEALKRWTEQPDARPEWISGPDLLRTVAARYQATVLPPQLVCPFDWREHRPAPESPAEDYPKALAFTSWAHNW